MPPKPKYTREEIINKAFEMTRKKGIDAVVARELGDTVEVCIEIMQKDYALNKQEAELLFRQVWLHTFGICVLVAGKVCQISSEEISEMLDVEFQGTLMLIKSGTFKAVPVNLTKEGNEL